MGTAMVTGTAAATATAAATGLTGTLCFVVASLAVADFHIQPWNQLVVFSLPHMRGNMAPLSLWLFHSTAGPGGEGTLMFDCTPSLVFGIATQYLD
ncbi:hypothetical protein Pelo_5030 [Pelomyxa schiedti]|nr:hypothetical protein Pelo_5030 [Pelomyxa schiedti]